MVDYLQLMAVKGKVESRNQEISQISRGLKSVAKELNLPLISLSQLSRRPEQRTGDHRPQLSDLASRARSSRRDLVRSSTATRSTTRTLRRRASPRSSSASSVTAIGDFKLASATTSPSLQLRAAERVRRQRQLTVALDSYLKYGPTAERSSHAGWSASLRRVPGNVCFTDPEALLPTRRVLVVDPDEIVAFIHPTSSAAMTLRWSLPPAPPRSGTVQRLRRHLVSDALAAEMPAGSTPCTRSSWATRSDGFQTLRPPAQAARARPARDTVTACVNRR